MRPLLAAAAELGPEASIGDAVLLATRTAWEGGDGAAVRALADGYGPSLLLTPARQDGAVVLRPVGTGERRTRGSFATPPALAAVLAERALRAQASTVVDPACGTGALLRAALDRLLWLGVPVADAGAVLHGVDVDPVAVEVCRTVLAVELTAAGQPCEPADLASRVVVGDALVDGDGWSWAWAFPDVLETPGVPPDDVTGWRGGFGAVLANPPWERLKVHARDWSGGAPPDLREQRAAAARAVRSAGRHPLTGVGELNAYLPFVETCWRLLAPQGRASVVVPAGIATDRSAGRLLRALVEADALERLVLLDPPAPLFPGVSTRVGVALVDLRGPAAALGDARSAEVTVGVPDPADVPARRSWRLDAALLRHVNPNSGTVPVCAGPRDAALLVAAHDRWPVLRRRDPSGRVVDDPWDVRLVTPLHMTRDVALFSANAGDGLVPLWEAKHAGLLDPRGGSRSRPRYWVPEHVMAQRFPELWRRGWLAGYRNVTTVDSPRTLLPTALPLVGVGNSLPLLSAPRLPLLLAALASLPVDFLVRCKHSGANLNFFKLEQVPLPRPEDYDRPAPWDPATTIAGWVLGRFAAAHAWTADLAALAAELRGLGMTLPRPDLGREAALADLDAAHAVLLGWSRDDLAHVLAGFDRLRRRDERRHGRFVTAERVLAAFDALT